jgi:hypothetical protein
MALTTALASVRPAGLGATIDWLVAHRAELERAYADGGDAPLALAVLPPACSTSPRSATSTARANDHALRERYLFADLVGRRSFSQAAIYAIAGLELSAAPLRAPRRFGIANLLLDPPGLADGGDPAGRGPRRRRRRRGDWPARR